MNRRTNTKPLASQTRAMHPVTYWITRDMDGDQLSTHVDVWVERPERSAGIGAWLDSTSTGVGMRYTRLPAEDVAAWGHTIPETSFERIKVETMGYAPA